MTSFNKLAISALLSALSLPMLAQVHAGDSVMEHANGKRLSIGGYGEVGYTRNFFSDHVSRYSQPEQHKDDPSHGKFDIPHAVIYVGYDFGKGWSMGTEIEFEHGGAGIAYEKEDEEGGEWEQETEKGGEVELEQFWVQKSFGRFANIRAGHIVVPVGLNNAHHEPLNFFTVYRPEGENTILPSTWHQTGVSFWGRHGDFRYEAQLLAGLNADHFTNTGWIHKGHKSPLEYDIANKYGVAARLDNYSLPGLRVALSGYYGQSIGNSYPRNANGVDNEYKGTVLVGSFDFTYNAHNWIVRGQADYGYLGDAEQLKYVYNRQNSKSPYKHSAFVSKNAYAIGIEAGYDVFSQVPSMRADGQKLYIFGRYEMYDPYASNTKNTPYDYTKLLPKYSNQTIWPYTDMVQHRLFMENDIRTGWCRTTPLWGRGLSRQLTGSDDRLHDCRARTEVEAIMWHGYSKESDAYESTVKFFNLGKSDRDAVVKFIRSI